MQVGCLKACQRRQSANHPPKRLGSLTLLDLLLNILHKRLCNNCVRRLRLRGSLLTPPRATAHWPWVPCSHSNFAVAFELRSGASKNRLILKRPPTCGVTNTNTTTSFITMCLALSLSGRRPRTVAPPPRAQSTTPIEGARPLAGPTTGSVDAASACDGQHLPCSTSPGTYTAPFAWPAELAAVVECPRRATRCRNPRRAFDQHDGRRGCLDTFDTTLLPALTHPVCLAAQATGSSPSSHASRWRCWRRITRSPRTSAYASACPCTVPGPSSPHSLPAFAKRGQDSDPFSASSGEGTNPGRARNRATGN